MLCTKKALKIVAMACVLWAPFATRAQTPPATPTAPASPNKTITVAADTMAAKRIDHVQPVYPPEALQAHVSGTVRLNAVVAKDGTVASVDVISGPPMLLVAAKEAAKQYRYQPTLLNGEPVAVATTVEVTFPPSEGSAPARPAVQPGMTAPPAPAPPAPPAVDDAWLKSQQAAAAAVDPAVADDVRRLLAVTAGNRATAQLVAPILQNVRAQLMQKLPASETREQVVDSFIEKLQAQFNNDDVAQLLIPVFAKHFTKQELDAVVAFYESPAGKAYVQNQKDLAPEAQMETGQYEQKVVMPQIIAAVTQQFPELMKPKQ